MSGDPLETESNFQGWTERLTKKIGLSGTIGTIMFVVIFYAIISLVIGELTSTRIFYNPFWYGWVLFFASTFLCVNYYYPRYFRKNIRKLSKSFSPDGTEQDEFVRGSEKLAFGMPMSLFSLFTGPFFFFFFYSFVITGNYLPVINLWIRSIRGCFHCGLSFSRFLASHCFGCYCG